MSELRHEPDKTPKATIFETQDWKFLTTKSKNEEIMIIQSCRDGKPNFYHKILFASNWIYLWEKKPNISSFEKIWHGTYGTSQKGFEISPHSIE